MIETVIIIYCIGVLMFSTCLMHSVYTSVRTYIRKEEQLANKIWLLEQYKNTGAYAKHSHTHPEITAPLKTYKNLY
jgi:quinol monooxygenase YgiN